MPVSAAPEPPPLRCHHGLRRQTIVESLLADIFQGRVRAGAHLVTRELAERFGVSHTPIREALIALAGIGIVDLLPNRGAVVRRVAAAEVREVCHVRQILECAATRLACGRIGLAELHTLAIDLKRLTVASPKDAKRNGRASPALSPSSFISQARVIDNRLHDLISASCGNGFLAKELGRLKILFRAFRDVSWEREEARNDYHRLVEEADEHLAIVDGLLAGDAREASRAMARHIRSGARYWSRMMPAPAGVSSSLAIDQES
jgi:DNA-binding GntR family transcriptional regulator